MTCGRYLGEKDTVDLKEITGALLTRLHRLSFIFSVKVEKIVVRF
jgi:hypothetical protein